jgi:hypothetical protein
LFLVWWIYAFLNDSEGRLYRWTDGKHGKPPAEVQKLLDAKKAAEGKAKVSTEAAVTTGNLSTNAPVAK